MEKPVAYTKHAGVVMGERGLEPEWVEAAVRNPQWVEVIQMIRRWFVIFARYRNAAAGTFA
jgi:hypothetical protein